MPRWRLLTLTWGAHLLAGERPASDALHCCVQLEEHWAGPHSEEKWYPLTPRATHALALDRTFGDARDALRVLNADIQKPHWWGQVRYRRCLIYFCVLALGCALLMWSLAHAFWLRRHMVTRDPKARSAL